MIDQGGRTNLGDKFFLAVILCSEEGGPVQAVQPLLVAGAVGQFVEDCAVVFCGANELLADGEDDFIRGGSVQIIYTTHSPYMIPSCFTSLRGITKSPEEEYSQIHNAFNSTSFQLNHALDTLTPIAAALGMDMRYSFAPMRDKFTIITEGITDQVYLTVMAEKLGFAMNNVCVIPSTGADNVKHLCSILLGWGFSFTALFDFDKAGRSGAHSIITHLGLEIGQGIELLKCISHDEFLKLEKIEDKDKLVIESIFSPEDRVAFGINPDDVMAQKKIAAKRFQHSIRIEQKDVSDETKSAFRELLSRLLKQAPQ